MLSYVEASASPVCEIIVFYKPHSVIGRPAPVCDHESAGCASPSILCVQYFMSTCPVFVHSTMTTNLLQPVYMVMGLAGHCS